MSLNFHESLKSMAAFLARKLPNVWISWMHNENTRRLTTLSGVHLYGMIAVYNYGNFKVAPLYSDQSGKVSMQQKFQSCT